MDKQPTRRGRGRPAGSGAGYSQRVPHYENEAGIALLQQLARQRGGVSVTALLRQLTREEARRAGLEIPEGAE